MIYLDNGATSFPKPRSVHAEMAGCMENYAANAGRGAHKMSVQAAEKIWETRVLLAKLFHIPSPERIVFTQNCTDSINIALGGIPESGDDLIISDMEHNSVYRPSLALSKEGVRTLFARAGEDGTVSPEAVLREITPRTRMICLQHASNVGGGINPIREIGRLARERGILFMVDAAQTAGCTSIDVERDSIDILAFPGHKGLLGPQGVGGLYIREGIAIRPMRAGGTGSLSESAEMPPFLPDRLEAGTVNLPGIAGLSGGVRFVLSKGVDRIEKYERRLCENFIRAVETIPGVRVLGPEEHARRVGVVSLALEERDVGEIAAVLDEKYGIATRAGLHCAPLAAARFGILDKGSIRFSPGVFTTPREMTYAARAMREILSR